MTPCEGRHGQFEDTEKRLEREKKTEREGLSALSVPSSFLVLLVLCTPKNSQQCVECNFAS